MEDTLVRLIDRGSGGIGSGETLSGLIFNLDASEWVRLKLGVLRMVLGVNEVNSLDLAVGKSWAVGGDVTQNDFEWGEGLSGIAGRIIDNVSYG